jgi:hypothetical protein
MHKELAYRTTEIHSFAEALLADLAQSRVPCDRAIYPYVVECLRRVLASSGATTQGKELETALVWLSRLTLDEVPSDGPLYERVSALLGQHQAFKRAERRLATSPCSVHEAGCDQGHGNGVDATSPIDAQIPLPKELE